MNTGVRLLMLVPDHCGWCRMSTGTWVDTGNCCRVANRQMHGYQTRTQVPDKNTSIRLITLVPDK